MSDSKEITGRDAIDLLIEKFPKFFKQKLESYRKDINEAWPDEPSSYLNMDVRELFDELVDELHYINLEQTLKDVQIEEWE